VKTDLEGDNIIQKVPLSVALSDPRCKWHNYIRKKFILIDTLNKPCALFTPDLLTTARLLNRNCRKKHHWTAQC